MLMLLFVTIWQQPRSCHSFKSSEDATPPYQQLINPLHSQTGKNIFIFQSDYISLT